MPERRGLASVFTDSEWVILTQVPTEAIMTVLLVRRIDAVALLLSAKIIVQVLIEEQRQNPSSALAKSLLDYIWETNLNETHQNREICLPEKEFFILGQLHALNNAVGGRQLALNRCRYASSLVSAKVTASQAEDFKRWLLSIACKVTDLVDESICPRRGNSDTMLDEKAALLELEEVL